MSNKYIREDISFKVNNREIIATVMSPLKENLAKNPAILLTFSMDGQQSLSELPYCVGSDMFLEKGHRSVSFDLPNHGNRINQYGSDIVGWRNSFINGSDPFKMFIEDATMLIDVLISKGFVKKGKIFISGVSRAGYLALRLFSIEKRIKAVTALAPVTDWRELIEFKNDISNNELKDISIENYITDMVGRPIYLAIGNSDKRVGTKSCSDFYNKLINENKRKGYNCKDLILYITNDENHSLDIYFRELGTKFLLEHL
ncbi:MAG: prolyl oligopeptidase family serine peptidase [Clostridiales bacterium]|nr:prolyl oligopeptidase family serine peptidase [Clostridiales bacterium]